MLQRLLAILAHGNGKPTGLSTADRRLLHWVLLCVGVPGCMVVLQACGGVSRLNEMQIKVLAAHPFYLSAEEAQVSLLSNGWIFTECVFLSFYLGAVLLSQESLLKRSYICFLALPAFGLPGLLCVLWHGVLYVAQPLVCILLLWLATLFVRKPQPFPS